MIFLNLGCGFNKLPNMVNVDAYDVCSPDVVWDLNKFPYPWEDNSVDGIVAYHIFEHLIDWWPAFLECTRILKPGGTLEIRVPDESSATALTYRDHHHVFGLVSFHGAIESKHGTSAWAKTVAETVPMKMIKYSQVPYKEYNWMFRVPWLLRFCAKHMRNFIHEQSFLFCKIGAK